MEPAVQCTVPLRGLITHAFQTRSKLTNQTRVKKVCIHHLVIIKFISPPNSFDVFVAVLFACRDIEVGDEINDCYIDLRQVRIFVELYCFYL